MASCLSSARRYTPPPPRRPVIAGRLDFNPQLISPPGAEMLRLTYDLGPDDVIRAGSVKEARPKTPAGLPAVVRRGAVTVTRGQR